MNGDDTSRDDTSRDDTSSDDLGSDTETRPDGGRENLLQVENVSKWYGDEQVLREVSFEMEKGDVTVLIGPSGSGKSTMLRCVNRLTDAQEGDIYLDGELITAPGMDVNRLRRDVGMVFQDINLFAHLTALGNVALGPQRVLGLDKKAARDRARRQLEQVGLAAQIDSYPAELSGGQKQRVGIARALAMEPKLMLFDEPTSALDPELVGEVLEVMHGLVEEGMTMLVVTHEMSFARSVADEIVFLDGGGVVERGPPEQLFEHPERDRTAQFLSRITQLHD